MPRKIMLAALGAALGVAAPALAQDAAPQPAAPAALANPDVVTVRNISRMELSPGMQIADDSGRPIGTVKAVTGNTIVISDGSADYRVPITQLYAWRQGAVDHFASRVSKSALTAEQEGG